MENSALSLAQETANTSAASLLSFKRPKAAYICKVTNRGNFYNLSIEPEGRDIFTLRILYCLEDRRDSICINMDELTRIWGIGDEYCNVEFGEHVFKLLMAALLLIIYDCNEYKYKKIEKTLYIQICKGKKKSGNSFCTYEELREIYRNCEERCGTEGIYINYNLPECRLSIYEGKEAVFSIVKYI